MKNSFLILFCCLFLSSINAYSQCVTGCNGNTGIKASSASIATIEYDNLVSGYHSTIVREDNGDIKVWGEYTNPDGTNHLTSPRIISSANGYNFTGTILKYAIGGNNDNQFAVLTTNGIYVWGATNQLISSGIKNTRAFGAITVGGNTQGLPAGVTPSDVKMLFGSYLTLGIVTCNGQAWVLSGSNAKSGDGTTGNNNVWHRVKTNATTNLENVVAMRGTGRAMIALTSSGALYTWGTGAYLGNNTAPASRTYATLMSTPQEGSTAITPKMIGMTIYNDDDEITIYYYVLATNGKIYSTGDAIGQYLGRTISSSNNRSWLPVKLAGNGADLTNITFFSPQEHDYNVPAVNSISTDGKLYNWGMSVAYMLGGVSANIYPRLVNGLSGVGLASNDVVFITETGGHTTMIIKECEDDFGYVGHAVNGSVANGVLTNDQYNNFTFSTAKVNLCGAAVIPTTISELKICPGTTANLADAYIGSASTNLTWYNGIPGASGTSIVSNPSTVGVGTYYASYGTTCTNAYSTVTVTQYTSHPAPIINPATNYTAVNSSYNIPCGAATANLSSLTASNKPAPATVTLTWHTATPATSSNKIANVTALTGTNKYYAAFFDATSNCYSPTKEIIVYTPICANDDDYSATPITAGVGGTLPSIFGNDTYSGATITTATSGNVSFNYSVWVPANGSINPATGVLTVPATTPPGNYVYSYQINDTDPDGVSDSNFSIATVFFRVVADSDGDGIHDEDDLDDDNDGILDKDECIGFISNNVNGAWKGRTASNITVSATPSTTQTNSLVVTTDPQVNFSINQNGGDQRFGNSATAISYVITFSTPVPANEIGLMIDDVNVNPGFSPSAAFKIDVDFGSGSFVNPNGVFLKTMAGRNNGVGIGYNIITGIPSFQDSPNPSGEDLYLRGSGNTLVKAVRLTGSNLGGSADSIAYSFFALGCDTDGDGTPDYLDLDSDGDGCSDAFEGDENVLASHLRVFGDINVTANGGVGSTPNVNNGVPNLVNSGGTADIGGDIGQGVGQSKNGLINLCCMNLPTAGTPDNYTQTGISNLAGFGTTGNGWPQNVPNGFVAIESKNQGFVITRVANTSAIATPVEGMLIYDISASCVKLYNGTTWKCLAKDCN